MTWLGRLRRWWYRRNSTVIDVPGGFLTYPCHLSESEVEAVRAAWLRSKTARSRVLLP